MGFFNRLLNVRATQPLSFNEWSQQSVELCEDVIHAQSTSKRITSANKLAESVCRLEKCSFSDTVAVASKINGMLGQLRSSGIFDEVRTIIVDHLTRKSNKLFGKDYDYSAFFADIMMSLESSYPIDRMN